MTSPASRDGDGRLEAEQSLRDMLEAADLTDEEAEARDRRAGLRDHTRKGEIPEDDDEHAEIEHRSLDRFLAGRERDDAIGLSTAVRHYLDDTREDSPGAGPS